MGFDAEFTIIHGYKICLEGQNILDFSILNGDDYQLIHDPDCRDELIDHYVLDVKLKEFLFQHDNWNIYVLTSSQDDPDLKNSYFFVYDKRQQVFYGRVPDYECGEVALVFEPKPDLPADGKPGAPYQQHWIVEGSW